MNTPTTEALFQAWATAEGNSDEEAAAVHALAAHTRTLDAEVTRLAGALEEARAEREDAQSTVLALRAEGARGDDLNRRLSGTIHGMDAAARAATGSDADTARAAIEAAEERGARAMLRAVSVRLMEVADSIDASEGDATEEGNALRRQAIALLDETIDPAEVTRTARSRP